MKTIVVIPTYDEKSNVSRMAEAVLAQTLKLSNSQTLELLFVDDNSPDGTGDVIEEMMKTEPRIHCLHREKKEGLGRAYVAGFQKAIELGAEKIVQMDCDFSHDPKDLPRLIAEDADLVIGSRYVKGGATPGWPFKRRLISRLGGIFIRTVTGMPLRDPTGGFKCWKASDARMSRASRRPSNSVRISSSRWTVIFRTTQMISPVSSRPWAPRSKSNNQTIKQSNNSPTSSSARGM